MVHLLFYPLRAGLLLSTYGSSFLFIVTVWVYWLSGPWILYPDGTLLSFWIPCLVICQTMIAYFGRCGMVFLSVPVLPTQWKNLRMAGYQLANGYTCPSFVGTTFVFSVPMLGCQAFKLPILIGTLRILLAISL